MDASLFHQDAHCPHCTRGKGSPQPLVGSHTALGKIPRASDGEKAAQLGLGSDQRAHAHLKAGPDQPGGPPH